VYNAIKRAEIEDKNQNKKMSMLGYSIAFIIPLVVVGYILYMSWLPFGYEKTYHLDVSSKSYADSSKNIHIVPTGQISDVKINGNESFRSIRGGVKVEFNPKVTVKNANVNISLEGESLSIMPPEINFDYTTQKWDSFIELQKEANIVLKEGCAYFNGSEQLKYNITPDKFDSGPFIVFVEWKPEDNTSNFQEIVGHYDWELLQYKDKVRFLAGRFNNKDGPFYDVQYAIDNRFFDHKHNAIAVYNPSEDGYIELFVDNVFTGRTYVGKDTIWEEYSQGVLTVGKSMHENANYYMGCVNKIGIYYGKIDFSQTTISFSNYTKDINFYIIGDGDINSVNLKIKK
jgi:hypothetical protein